MISVKIGDKAPSIIAKDQFGNKIDLKDYTGSKVILFFYPKADTPGCTSEACNLRDHYAELTARGFKIIGVSADDENKQRKFSEKYNFPYPLIPDTDKSVIRAFGVWGPKKFMGKSYDGINRTTFLIAEDGKIDRIITKVKTGDHAAQILEEYN
ncbi:MAG: thioredoxin-dependent thiol peroxidase [Bacteroidales bacterium]